MLKYWKDGISFHKCAWFLICPSPSKLKEIKIFGKKYIHHFSQELLVRTFIGLSEKKNNRKVFQHHFCSSTNFVRAPFLWYFDINFCQFIFINPKSDYLRFFGPKSCWFSKMSFTDISFTLIPGLASPDLMNTFPVSLHVLFVGKGLLINCGGKGFEKFRLFETAF